MTFAEFMLVGVMFGEHRLLLDTGKGALKEKRLGTTDLEHGYRKNCSVKNPCIYSNYYKEFGTIMC